MKAWILSIAFFLGSFSFATAQSYKSIFGSESTQWNMTMGNLWGAGTTEHHVIADTIIDGLTYKVVNGYEGAEDILGFVRQDANHEKAWYRNNMNTEEVLIMDLSLEVGDSMYIGGNWNPNKKYYMVDSVYYKNDLKHIRFDFQPPSQNSFTFTVVEGVVSNMGFRYQDEDYINAFPSDLLCVLHNDVKIYGLNCSSNTNRWKKMEELKVYPNPCRDLLHIELKESITSGQLDVFNHLGAKVFCRKGRFSSSETLDLSTFGSGVYCVKIYDMQRNTVRSTKFVVLD